MGWLAQLGSFGISRLRGEGVGSFWFVLVRFQSDICLGSFGLVRTIGFVWYFTLARQRRLSSGVA
jgi:hypothetical protein